MDKNDKSNSAHPDYQFYISYDFYKKDNPHFHRRKLYGFNQGNILLILNEIIDDISRILHFYFF